MKCIYTLSDIDNVINIPKGKFVQLSILNVYCNLNIDALLLISVSGFDNNVYNDIAYTSSVFLNKLTKIYDQKTVILSPFDTTNLHDNEPIKIKFNFINYLPAYNVNLDVIKHKLIDEPIILECLLVPEQTQNK